MRLHSFQQNGFGFLESICEKCLLIELGKAGLQAEAQVPIEVFYDDELVGQFAADIVVNSKIILELKSVRKLVQAHEVQLVNYLTSTNTEVGLLINFGEQGVEVKRKLKTLPAQA